MKKITSKRFIIPFIICVALILGVGYFYLFSSIAKGGKTHYLYIDNDDNIDSIYEKLDTITTSSGMAAFSMLARHSDYADNIALRNSVCSITKQLLICAALSNKTRESIANAVSLDTIENYVNSLSNLAA